MDADTPSPGAVARERATWTEIRTAIQQTRRFWGHVGSAASSIASEFFIEAAKESLGTKPLLFGMALGVAYYTGGFNPAWAIVMGLVTPLAIALVASCAYFVLLFVRIPARLNAERRSEIHALQALIPGPPSAENLSTQARELLAMPNRDGRFVLDNAIPGNSALVVTIRDFEFYDADQPQLRAEYLAAFRELENAGLIAPDSTDDWYSLTVSGWELKNQQPDQFPPVKRIRHLAAWNLQGWFTGLYAEGLHFNNDTHPSRIEPWLERCRALLSATFGAESAITFMSPITVMHREADKRPEAIDMHLQQLGSFIGIVTDWANAECPDVPAAAYLAAYDVLHGSPTLPRQQNVPLRCLVIDGSHKEGTLAYFEPAQVPQKLAREMGANLPRGEQLNMPSRSQVSAES